MASTLHRSAGVALLLGAAPALSACTRGASTPAPVTSAAPARARAEALASIVAAERAFVVLARDSGTWAAFVANMADSGMLLRPTPVNAREWLLAHPNPDRTGLLAWEPRYADVSRSGDFGWTTGPYEVRPDRAKPEVAARGNFLTVWRRDGNGPWKVLFDGGNGLGPWTLTADGWGEWTSPPAAGAGDRLVATSSAETLLLTVDESLGRAGREGRPFDALAERLDDDAFLYRQGMPTVRGREPVRAALAAVDGSLTSRPLGAELASSGDLAFTHGTYELAPTAGAPESGHYVRLWRRDAAGAWRVAFDVTFPLRRRG